MTSSHLAKSICHRIRRRIPTAPFIIHRTTTTTTTTKSNSTSITSTNNQLFLHVAPCGDYWTGHEVFAAKHLQPDYVKSIPIPKGLDPEEILSEYDGDVDVLVKKVYDSGDISLIQVIGDR